MIKVTLSKIEYSMRQFIFCKTKMWNLLPEYFHIQNIYKMLIIIKIIILKKVLLKNNNYTDLKIFSRPYHIYILL